MSVETTWLGFKFRSDDSSTVTYSGYFRKNSVRRFLEGQGVNFTDA
jgi:hypothetical protein